MRWIVPLTTVCLSLSSFALSAATLDGLYQVREPIASQQPGVRDEALRKAWDTLVIRLTGQPEALKNSSIAQLRQDPQQVVRQFGYENDSLVVEFDPGTVERRVRQAGLPLWGANRPSILTWWLDESPQGASLAGDNQSSAEALRTAAAHRGLPLRLPLADLQEQLVATPETLSQGASDALVDASSRYQADGLLSVRASENDGQWQADWQFSLQDQQESGQATADSREALADAVMLTLSERLAPRFAITPGAESRFELHVAGTDLARYAELQRTLEPFGAQLVALQGNAAIFDVNADEQQLRTQLSLVGLRESPAPAEPLDANQPAVAPQPGTVSAPPAPPAPAAPAVPPLYFGW